jgi:pyrimidine deaminase RibD-like protein
MACVASEIPPARLEQLMRLAIDEARASVDEDARVHPRVGAVLTDQAGTVLVKTHRGEVRGAHAEYVLLERARAAGIDPEGCVVLTTLEPCTYRGEGKVPCAERIAASGVAAVYIGTLDPNPNITGRGEMLLNFATDVGRFPLHLARELTDLNREFFDAHGNAHAPGNSAANGISKPEPALDRNDLLRLTLDLVSGDDTHVIWVRAAAMSWWRDTYLAFLGAVLAGRDVRLLWSSDDSHPASSGRVLEAALAIGADVGVTPSAPAPEGTMIDPHTDHAAMVLVDTGRRTLLRASDDDGLLEVLAGDFERRWSQASVTRGRSPEVMALTDEQLATAMRSGIGVYAGLDIVRAPVAPGDTLPVTRHLDDFKLFRAVRLDATLAARGLPSSALIKGVPWPITPPVVERRPDGRLVVIDGTHRFYQALRRGSSAVDALVVDGCTADLPGAPAASWDEVTVWHTSLPRHRRYENYRESAFRPIQDVFCRLVERLESEG